MVYTDNGQPDVLAQGGHGTFVTLDNTTADPPPTPDYGKQDDPKDHNQTPPPPPPQPGNPTPQLGGHPHTAPVGGARGRGGGRGGINPHLLRGGAARGRRGGHNLW